MMNFESRIGPPSGLPRESYPECAVPEWYRDAKLGFFIHWGLYSVPAWAYLPEAHSVPTEDAYAFHQYAEWYGNTVRIPGSPTWERHQELYGPGVSYEDLADQWDAPDFSGEALISEIQSAGARYVIPTTKHHDGFCLWNTSTTRFSSWWRGPRRDLIKEVHDAVRQADMRFGVYFSGALDWHVSDYPPIESDTDLFRYRRNDEHFSRYAARQLDELIEQFAPDLLWNDIEWPDGGKGHEEFGLAALMRRYFSAVPQGVINDRWGVPVHGFLTREYSEVLNTLPHPWESTRGLGASFGYNRDESEALSLTGHELIRHLVDVVSKNGNLLINVGPRADGSIPEIQRNSMREMGRWLGENASAIYGTRPWVRPNERCGAPLAYTTSREEVHVHIVDPSAGQVQLPAEFRETMDGRWADSSVADISPDGVVTIPGGLRGSPVAVLTFRAAAGS